MAYNKIAKFKAFENQPKPGTNQPAYGNVSVRIETTIQPGEYSVGVWQYPDEGKGRSMSIELTQRVDDGNQAPAAAPPPATNTEGDFDDPANW